MMRTRQQPTAGCLAAALALTLMAPLAARAQLGPVETVVFEAPSVGRTMRYDVILPAAYHDPTRATERFPTLYLLHGAGDHAGSWRSILGGAPGVSDHDLILVLPDAGDSYYVDWAESDSGPAGWERYVVDDVRQDVEARYRAVPRREGRAVTGYGIGGHGALAVGLRNPDLFVAVGSQLGELLWAREAADRLRLDGLALPPASYAPEVEAARGQEQPGVGVPGFSSLVERTPRGQPFTTPAEAFAHDPFRLVILVDRDRVPLMQLDGGGTIPSLEISQRLARVLMDADLPFVFTQRRGGRDRADWGPMYDDVIAWHYRVMRQALDRADAAGQ